MLSPVGYNRLDQEYREGDSEPAFGSEEQEVYCWKGLLGICAPEERNVYVWSEILSVCESCALQQISKPRIGAERVKSWIYLKIKQTINLLGESPIKSFKRPVIVTQACVDDCKA